MTDSPAVNIEDDLTAFEAEFFGKAKPAEPAPEVEEVVEPDEVSEVEELEDTDAPESEDDDDEADPDLEDEEPEEEDEKPQRRNRKTAKERIKELTAERETALRELAIEREVIRRLKEAEVKPTDVKVDAKEVEAPNPDAVNDKGEPLYPLGEFDPSYIRALHRFTADQELARTEKVLEEKRIQAEQLAQRQKQQQSWTQKLEATEKEYPDVRDKIATLDHMFSGIEPQYGQYLVDVIQSLDSGPLMLRYLADHPEEAKQIVAAGHTVATLSLGRLDAQLASSRLQKEKPTPKVTKATPPPKAAPRGTGGKFTVAADTDDLDAFADIFFKKK